MRDTTKEHIKEVPYEHARKYVQLMIGEHDMPPTVADTLRRRTHDSIARRLNVSTDLIKRAAHIVEWLYFSPENVFRDYDAEKLSKFFKKHLDDIYLAKINGRFCEMSLIPNWTFDALHPETMR